MVWGLLTSAFLVATMDGPLDHALDLTTPPNNLRAAFTVEITDGSAYRQVRFDPRDVGDDRWELLKATGESEELDKAVDEWGGRTSPDSWLFADDLRASMGRIVEAEDLGGAWRVHFQHQVSDNDGPLDVWAAEHLAGFAWLEPVNGYFLRVEYESLEPFDMPAGGGHIDSYRHIYVLGQDPKHGVSYVSDFKVDVRGKFLGENIERSYRVKISELDFFYVQTEASAQPISLLSTAMLSDERPGG